MSQRIDEEPAGATTARSRRPGRRSRFAALAAAALLAVLGAGCGSSSTGAAPSTDEALSLVVGTRNTTVPQASLYWAAAKGYFTDAGLDLSIKVGEAAQAAQLVAGQTDLYWGAQGALLGVVNSGKPVTTIYGMDAGASGYVVASTPEVATPADCRTVTSATPGTVLFAWTKQLEKIYGTSWKLTQLTAVPAIAANVSSGATDCAIGNVSYYQAGIDEAKLRVVLDPSAPSTLPPGWPTLGVEDVVGGLPETLQAKRRAVERFLAAYDKALRDYRAADPRDIAQTLIDFDPGFSAVGSVDVLATSIEQFRPFLSPNGGAVSEQVWANTLTFFEEGGLDFLATDRGRFEYPAAVDMSYYNAAIGAS